MIGMKGFLTENQIEYVLFHLNMGIFISDEISEHFWFVREKNDIPALPKIIFALSSEAYDPQNVIFQDELPVLFPGKKAYRFYTIEGNSVIFHHDLLKSSFYLLSGYQEIYHNNRDRMNRFPFAASMQSMFDFASRPLVNYYFKIVSEGIRKFCDLNGLTFKEKRAFEGGCLFMTHDVDQVDTYTIHEVIYRIKQALGLAEIRISRIRSIRIALKYIGNYLNIFHKENPAWNFEYLRDTEKKYQINSAFYFLPKGLLHQDAYYSFREKRIRHLLDYLDRDKCELGLHGTVRSAISGEILCSDYRNLRSVSPQIIQGVRQHRLIYQMGITNICMKKPALYMIQHLVSLKKKASGILIVFLSGPMTTKMTE